MVAPCPETSPKCSRDSQGNDRRFTAARVVSAMSVGGVQRGILETLRHRDRETWNVKLICLDREGQWKPFLTEMGVETRLLAKGYPWRKMFSISVLRRLGPMVSWLRRNRVAVLHIHQAKPVLFMVLAGKIARVPCIVVHHHSVYEDHFWKHLSPERMRWEKRMTNRADGVIAVSETVAECTHRVLGVPREKIRVIPNGVTRSGLGNERSAPVPEMPPGAKIVGGVGRLVPDKCWDDFIRAAALVLPNVPNARFWLIGDEEGKDSVREDLEALARELGIADRFHFLGFRTDAGSLLRFLDVGVLCSRREGCPNALLEYLSASVPAVTSDIPSITEFVRNEETALVTPLGRPEELARGIERLLRDEALAGDLARRGLERARGFTWENAERNYEAFYREILEAKGCWSR